MEQASQHRDARRAAAEGEWEVFVREADRAPLTHVGSVTAETDEEARRTATRLFEWCGTDIWVCPAEAVRRFAPESGAVTDGEADA